MIAKPLASVALLALLPATNMLSPPSVYAQEIATDSLQALITAAEQGDAAAQRNLGVMYDDGEGVVQNYILAYAWLNLAGAQGSEEARKARDLLSDDVMTREQVMRAQEMSVELQREIDNRRK